MYSTRMYGLKPVPGVIKYVEPVKCKVYPVLLIEACTIGGAKGSFTPSCSSKSRMIDRWEVPKISVISVKVDRVAVMLVVIGEILPISYGIRTEIERLRALVLVIPKILQMFWLCTNNSAWRSVKIK